MNESHRIPPILYVNSNQHLAGHEHGTDEESHHHRQPTSHHPRYRRNHLSDWWADLSPEMIAFLDMLGELDDALITPANSEGQGCPDRRSVKGPV